MEEKENPEWEKLLALCDKEDPGWKNSFMICHKVAVVKGKPELAIKFKKYAEMTDRETLSRNELLLALEEAKSLLNEANQPILFLRQIDIIAQSMGVMRQPFLELCQHLVVAVKTMSDENLIFFYKELSERTKK